jgi:isopentenyldiphosphate isomerase/intracellular septation protein A
MRPNRILLSFLPGFAPILVYILVDSFLGETAGLAAGILLGMAEFLFILLREKRVDAFTLVDTALLVAMGAVSLALSDPVFFRLKPAISGGILASMMLAGSLGPRRLFLPYMENKMGMGTLSKETADRMLAMIAGFGFLTLAHSALTAAAALWWPKPAWNFVAGALFWILSLGYIAAWTIPAFAAAYRRKGNRRGKPGVLPEGVHEMLPVVDEDGKIIGKATRPVCHDGTKLLHPVVRLWLTDGMGGCWMQKRAAAKPVQGGKWDCAVGGHISFGETAHLALMREAFEEIGLSEATATGCLSSVRPLLRFVWESPLERELVHVYTAELLSAEKLFPDGAEVDEIRLWSAGEIRDELMKGKEGRLTELACAELLKFGAGSQTFVL